MSPAGTESLYAKLEICLSGLEDGSKRYAVELRYANPEKPRINPARRIGPFETAQLSGLAGLAYGQMLSKLTFGESGPLCQMFNDALIATGKLPLRICLQIDQSAAELRILRWELLTAPGATTFLATDDNSLFSRYMTSNDWNDVSRRARGDLRALIAVPDTEKGELPNGYNLADIDASKWRKIAETKLAGATFDFVGRDEPLTLVNLTQKLRQGTDILYLVCHGSMEAGAVPSLILEDKDRLPESIPASELADQIRALQFHLRPRLVILVSCESDGPSELPAPGSLADDGSPSLASLLAEAGVLAVVCMRGKISMDSMEIALPVFLEQLMDNGQVDHAMSAARRAIRGREDFWIPALYSRLTDCRLWYQAGFDGDEFKKWEAILTHVGSGKFIPILGPNINEPVYGDTAGLAAQLAKENNFPLAEYQLRDLAQVAQFLSVKNDIGTVRAKILEAIKKRTIDRHPSLGLSAGSEFGQIWDKLHDQGVQPYPLITRLNADIYVTATQDSLLKLALQRTPKRAPNGGNKIPRVVFCKWKGSSASPPSIAADQVNSDAPIVYQILGSLSKDNEDSLVLTEDDYLDYLIAISKHTLIPEEITSKCNDSSMFFLGFQLTDLSFRVLFRFIRNLDGSSKQSSKTHVGVQVDPNEQDFADVAAARNYLANYGSKNSNLEIYWGSALDFLCELDRRLTAKGVVPNSGGDDGA